MTTRDWARAMQSTQALRGRPGATLPACVLAPTPDQMDRPALIGPDSQLTYGALGAMAHRYARWALREGIATGDVVALVMPNCPDYAAIWLGLTQIGCVVALLNTNLAGDAMAHCIDAAAALHVIVAASLIHTVDAALARAPTRRRWWRHGAAGLDPSDPIPMRIDLAIAALDASPLRVDEQRPPRPRDHALLIYTSGTTGLPKAAHITHARVLDWGGWFAGLIDAKPDDRLYNCLPMYHSTGGVVAIGCMLLGGGAIVIRPRFSARQFWPDIVATGCTIVQYIGELCRYLLQVPHQPDEARHHVRLCCGNGLRGDVWEAFQARFAIPRILEFYAATEGGVSLYNVGGRPGAIGQVPAFLAHRFPIALIRCDPQTGTALRDGAGNCMRCAVGEVGEAIAPLGDPSDETAPRFDGYTDPAATERKLLHDVFAPGDRWFRTGDLMRRDAAGYYYFIDRMGDTFRWKGENVSATEVAAIIAATPGVLDCVVFGVAVPNADGKAGMAALVIDAAFSLPALRTRLQTELPSYARPLFIRICGAIAMTGTFKLQKAALERDGYLSPGTDAVWFDDRQADAYVPHDPPQP